MSMYVCMHSLSIYYEHCAHNQIIPPLQDIYGNKLYIFFFIDTKWG